MEEAPPPGPPGADGFAPGEDAAARGGAGARAGTPSGRDPFRRRPGPARPAPGREPPEGRRGPAAGSALRWGRGSGPELTRRAPGASVTRQPRSSGFLGPLPAYSSPPLRALVRGLAAPASTSVPPSRGEGPRLTTPFFFFLTCYRHRFFPDSAAPPQRNPHLHLCDLLGPSDLAVFTRPYLIVTRTFLLFVSLDI